MEPDGRIIGQMFSERTVEEVAQELGEIEAPVFPSVERVDVAEGRQLLIEAWGWLKHRGTEGEHDGDCRERTRSQWEGQLGLIRGQLGLIRFPCEGYHDCRPRPGAGGCLSANR